MLNVVLNIAAFQFHVQDTIFIRLGKILFKYIESSNVQHVMEFKYILLILQEKKTNIDYFCGCKYPSKSIVQA
jgi:hypothetical protein